MSGFEEKFYEEEEAEQILRLAASLSSYSGTMSRERLLSTAAELGITPEAVELAERQISEQRQSKQDRIEFDAHQRRDFFGHLVSYVLVNGFLVLVNLTTSPGYFWAMWPILGWGLGLAFHFAETYLKRTEGYQEGFEEWQRKKRRRNERALENHRVVGEADFLIEKYVNRRMEKGRDISRIDAIRYLREKSDLDLREAKDAVDQYVARNPGVMN